MLRDFESRLRRFASTFERRPFFNWFPRTSRATEGSCSRQFPCVEWKFGIDFSLFFSSYSGSTDFSARNVTLPPRTRYKRRDYDANHGNTGDAVNRVVEKEERLEPN